MCLLCCRLLLPCLIRQRRRHAVSNRGRGRRWRLSLCHVVCSRLHGCLQGRLGWPWRSRCGTRLIIKQLPPPQDATVSVARPSVGSPMLPCRIMIRLAHATLGLPFPPPTAAFSAGSHAHKYTRTRDTSHDDAILQDLGHAGGGARTLEVGHVFLDGLLLGEHDAPDEGIHLM